MKRLLIFGLFATVIALPACNKGGNNADTNANLHNEMLQANRHVQKAIETGNVDTLRKYISTDATDHGGGPNGSDVKGEEIIKMLSSVHNDINNLKMETISDAANDDYIFALVHMTGTTNKPVWGMPANSKVDNKSVDVIKVKDMKMVDHWSYVDPAEMMKMMPPGGSGAGSSNSANVHKDSMK
jgi:predicted ester cyclase